jgi:guanine nucleotide exchange factor VAV
MAELWKQCADWLLRLKVLPDNHRVVWPDATIQDIAYALRDGVLLCHVANTIDPAAIDMRMVNQRPQMAQFLCLKNIRIFLNCLPPSFGLLETELFQPSHLYDYTDFQRVLHTLSKLSNCPKAKATHKGFPQNTRPDATQDEAQIYRTLEELVSDKNYEEFYYKHHGGSGSLGRGVPPGGPTAASAVGGGGEGMSPSRQYYTAAEQEEVIYEDLCSFKSKSSARLQQQLNFVPKEKRDYCVRELFETEGSYVDVLNMLRKHFIKVITAMKDADKKVVFINIKDLGETHAAFYQDILESVSGKSRKRIGEIFLEFKDRFLKYGEYCSSLPKAQETLDTLMAKDEAVREEVSKCESAANEGKFRLRDLLAIPMQRVLKYHLILRELMANTIASHEEYHAIQQAYDAMLDVSDYINEVKRDSEQLHIIREIQKSITEWNMPNGVELKDYGRLRKDCELKVQCHGDGGAAVAGGVSSNGTVGGGGGGGSGKTKIRYVFVFDKVMLMCKATRGDHYSYKDSLKLCDYKVQEVVTTAADTAGSSSTLGHARRLTQRVGSDSRWAFSFLLVHVKNLHAYTMFARTEEDKNKWVSAIREALGNINPLRALPLNSPPATHEVHMHTFDRPTTCDYCHRLLKGMFYQGYRCEKCARSMHKNCVSLLAKCGPPSIIPPRLPPRPPSMQLPVPIAGSNRFSTCSIDEVGVGGGGGGTFLSRQSSNTSMFTSSTLPPPMAPMAPPPMGNGFFSALSNGSNPDYINTKMEEHSWYVGDMDRDSANTRLDEFPVGTFLVRCRVHQANGDKLGYALSLKTENDVKHMKICSSCSAMTDSFFLSDTRKFRSVVELISWFSRNSLKEAFSGLDSTLRFSIGELTVVEAQFDFAPDTGANGSMGGNMLPLKAGNVVTVIDKTGDSQGWWKAYDGFRVGFVPKDFVQERNKSKKNENEDTVSSSKQLKSLEEEEKKEAEADGED